MCPPYNKNACTAAHIRPAIKKPITAPTTVLNTVLDKKELYAQAQCVLFATKVKEAVTEKLAEIRALNNTFEGTTEYTL